MSKKFNDMVNNGEFGLTPPSLLSNNNYANLFNVVNKGEKSYFNLTKGISFDNIDGIDESMFNRYMIQDDDCWTNISYKYFNTIELWWLICKFNNVKNPFDELEAGKMIKIPSDELKDTILESIKKL